MNLLALIFGRWTYRVLSKFVRLLLVVRGVRVGKNFHIEGVPKLIIDGKANNIVIGNNVQIRGSVELKVRENGKIEIGDGCIIDRDCRFVVANDSTLSLGTETGVGLCSVFNCGADVTIGKKTMVSGFVHIQSSNHKVEKDMYIQDQGYTYGAITIGDDVWLGASVSVLAGVKIGQGAVVGNKAVVTKSVEPYEIVAGVPARNIGYRE